MVPKSSSATSAPVTVKLPFQHPVTEYIVTLQDEAHIKEKDWFNWSGKYGQDPIKEMGVSINNSPRISRRPAGWFRMCEPDEHHTRIPKRHLYSCSWAAYPEEADQPSGALNQSRLDDVSIHIVPQAGLGNAICKVWTRSHNVFRVTRGLAGLAWQ